MPEHVHLLLSEPERGTQAHAMHQLKLSFTKQLGEGCFWQDRGYDRNVRNAEEFAVKLAYLHENPVKAWIGEGPEDWKWSSFRHYAFREVGVVEIESEWTARDCEGKPRIFLGDPFVQTKY